MTRDAARISLAGASLEDTRHVCAFFTSDDEEYGMPLPFIKDGFEQGDKAIHIVKPDCRSAETYLRGSSFDQERMLGVFEGLADMIPRNPFPSERFIDEFRERRAQQLWRRGKEI